MVPSLHCFPPSLVDTPLPLKKFGDYMLPVPRGMKLSCFVLVVGVILKNLIVFRRYRNPEVPVPR